MPKRARDSDDTEWRRMTRRRTHWYMKGSERGGGVKMIDRMLRLPVDLYERILGFVHGLEPVSQIMRSLPPPRITSHASMTYHPARYAVRAGDRERNGLFLDVTGQRNEACTSLGMLWEEHMPSHRPWVHPHKAVPTYTCPYDLMSSCVGHGIASDVLRSLWRRPGSAKLARVVAPAVHLRLRPRIPLLRQ